MTQGGHWPARIPQRKGLLLRQRVEIKHAPAARRFRTIQRSEAAVKESSLETPANRLKSIGNVDYSPFIEVAPMTKYVPSPRDWVREQVKLYESSGGTEGTTLRDTGLPVIIVTHMGNKTGAIRKTPLMRVKDGNSYVLVGSQGGAPTDPAWVHNLRANQDVEIRDETVVRPMRVREVEDAAERSRLWQLAIAAYPPYAEYQERTARRIPLFIAERS